MELSERGDRCIDQGELPPARLDVRPNKADAQWCLVDWKRALRKVVMADDRRSIEHPTERRHQPKSLCRSLVREEHEPDRCVHSA